MKSKFKFNQILKHPVNLTMIEPKEKENAKKAFTK